MSHKKAVPKQLNITVSDISNLSAGKGGEAGRNVQVQMQVEDLGAATQFVSGTCNPKFNEEFSVVLTSQIAPILVLNVIHKDDPSKVDCKEENIGVVKIKLGLLEGRGQRDLKYNLEKKVIWSEEEVSGEMRVLVDYSSEVTMNPDDTKFEKMAEEPKSTGKLLEFYIKELDKLRGTEKDLERRVERQQKAIAKLEKEKEKLVDITGKLEKGQEVLEELQRGDKAKQELQEKFDKLSEELSERDLTISRKDKQIMQLEKVAAQNQRIVKRMSTAIPQGLAAAGLLAPGSEQQHPPADDTAGVADALNELDLTMPAGGGKDQADVDDEDDAESEDEEEEGGQPDEEAAAGGGDGDGAKWKKKFEKEKAAKNEWKGKYDDMENLYNEIVMHRQQQMAQLSEQQKKISEMADSQNLEEIKQLREDREQLREEVSSMKMEMKLMEGQYDEAMKKYRKEAKERKKIYNEIQELKGNIRVYCRCRPISSAELERGATDATAFGDLDDVAIFSPDGTKKSFEFDRTFDQSSTQEAVFEDTLPLMQSVLDGFNVCIFAYGQTGSGKTFTMQGPDENPGVNIRSLQKLFTLVSEKGDDFEFEMGIAIFEIYCDQLRDLLVKDSPDLKIRQDKRNGRVHNFVDGLSQRVVASVDDVNQTIALANSNRSTASTNMNAYSSRSHLIMTVEVATIDKLSNKRTQAALHMIDLAGSERVGRSGVQGQALKEAQFINQSLAALGNTLSALGRKDGHVPYRDSKLTHSLADALGGNSKVLMFCNISPSSDNVSETLSSLQFATRARAVELGKATANVSGSDKPPAELADEDEAPAAAAPAAASKGRTSSAAARPSTKLPAAKAAGRAAPAAAAAGRAKPSPRATTTTPRASLGARKPAVAGRK